MSQVEPDAPNVEKTCAIGEEVDRFTIWRPARLVVPILALGDARPFTARNWHDINARESCIGGFDSVEGNPAIVGREMRLPDVILRMSGYYAGLRFVLGSRRNWGQANLVTQRVSSGDVSQYPLPVASPLAKSGASNSRRSKRLFVAAVCANRDYL